MENRTRFDVTPKTKLLYFAGLSRKDLVEMQNFIDDEVVKFVDGRRF